MTEVIHNLLEEAKVLLAEHPELAVTSTVVRAELGRGTDVQVRAGRYAFLADEPQAAGGTGLAASPVQYAFGALAACTAVTFRYWSVLLGVPFDRLSVEVRGEGDLRWFLGFDGAGAAGFANVRQIVTLAGPEDERRYRDLHAAVEAHCPVFNALARPTTLTSDLLIEPGRDDEAS